MARIDRITRRGFMKGSLAAAGPLIVPAWVLGQTAPSTRINVGIIGLGAMGSGHVRRMANDASVQVLGVCEVDRSRRERSKEGVDATYAEARAKGAYKGCAAYNDYREMLERPDVDAVVIATPDHWHTLMSIDAAKAGKDVYCEKPISMTLREGRDLADTMKRYARVFQTGTQYRSITTIRKIVQFVRDGGLGKVKQVFTILDPLNTWLRDGRFRPYDQFLDTARTSQSYVPLDFPLPAEKAPEGLDWELWVGPAPWRDYHPLYHTNPGPGVVPWSFADAFGVASITWHLSHSTDVIQYALGRETSGPVEIIHPSSGEFPTMTLRYEDGVLLHFVDQWGQVKSKYGAVGDDVRFAGLFGGLFIGERGWVTSMTGGGPIEGSPDVLAALGLASREISPGDNDHHANWLKCIRTRQRPSCWEEIGHRSASAGHLPFVSYKVGRSLKWDVMKEEFVGDEAANRLRSRAMREPWRI